MATDVTRTTTETPQRRGFVKSKNDRFEDEYDRFEDEYDKFDDENDKFDDENVKFATKMISRAHSRARRRCHQMASVSNNRLPVAISWEIGIFVNSRLL